MPKIEIISAITTEKDKIALPKAEKFSFSPQIPNVLKFISSFKLHYVHLHYVEVHTKSLAHCLKSCSSA